MREPSLGEGLRTKPECTATRLWLRPLFLLSPPSLSVSALPGSPHVSSPSAPHTCQARHPHPHAQGASGHDNPPALVEASAHIHGHRGPDARGASGGGPS